jgi:protein-S-isoprenylcysteine O-methyltransferase Ste14
LSRAKNTQQSVPTLWISLSFTVLLVLIATSFQKYYFLAPSETNSTLAFFQILYTAGWFILVAVPPLVLLLVPYRGLAIKIWLIAASAIFPIAVIGDHATLYATFGDAYTDYLITYPVLLVSHVLIPAAYILLFSLRGPARETAATD